MAMDPETKKELDAVSARILSLTEELGALKKAPNPNTAEISALKADLDAAKVELADLKKAKAGDPPKPVPADPELEDEPYTEAAGFGFFRFPGKRPKAVK